MAEVHSSTANTTFNALVSSSLLLTLSVSQIISKFFFGFRGRAGQLTNRQSTQRVELRKALAMERERVNTARWRGLGNRTGVRGPRQFCPVPSLSQTLMFSSLERARLQELGRYGVFEASSFSDGLSESSIPRASVKQMSTFRYLTSFTLLRPAFFYELADLPTNLFDRKVVFEKSGQGNSMDFLDIGLDVVQTTITAMFLFSIARWVFHTIVRGARYAFSLIVFSSPTRGRTAEGCPVVSRGAAVGGAPPSESEEGSEGEIRAKAIGGRQAEECPGSDAEGNEERVKAEVGVEASSCDRTQELLPRKLVPESSESVVSVGYTVGLSNE